MNQTLKVTLGVITLLLICPTVTEGSRQGWKTSGNGYLIYNAHHHLPNSPSGKLDISGIFSTNPNSFRNNTIITANHGNGMPILTLASVSSWDGHQSGPAGQWFVIESLVKTKAKDHYLVHWKHVDRVNDGYVYSLRIKIDQNSKSNGSYWHNVTYAIGNDRNPDSWSNSWIDDLDWDIDSVTLNIGGHNTTAPLHGNYNFFEGCLSDFMFEDVDIIQKYFEEYPNNVNPVRSSFSIGNFSHVPQTCDDYPRDPTTSKSMNLESSLRCFFLTAVCFLVLLIY